MAVTVLVMVLAVIFVYDAPLENNANPLSTPLHTLAPWYFLWIQGLLKLGDKTLMGVIVPTILLLAFIVMPYIDVGPFRRYHKRRIAISMSLVFIALIAVLSWMGTPAFLVQTSADQEILFELAPGEKVGPLRRVPYEELEALVGTAVSVDDYEETIPRSSRLWHVMEEYEEMVHEAREEGELENAEAFLVINQLQADVVGVTLRITWDGADGPQSNELLVPIQEHAFAFGRGH